MSSLLIQRLPGYVYIQGFFIIIIFFLIEFCLFQDLDDALHIKKLSDGELLV